MDFLESLSLCEADLSAQETTLHSPDGRPVRGNNKRRGQPEYEAAFARLQTLLGEAMHGDRRATYLLSEAAMTTSDFPLLFGDVLDRQLLDHYRTADPIWPAIAGRKSVRDFRDVKEFPRPTGGSAILSEVTAEDGTYPVDKLDEGTPYSYHVSKRGRIIPFSFETWMNDDMDALKDVPERFALAARETEEYLALSLMCDASGPHASMYTGGNANIVTSNAAFSESALATAFRQLQARVSADGNPIVINMATLVVPPGLWVQALKIMNATELRFVEGNNTFVGGNWLKGMLQLKVAPWIPHIATSANGDTSWWLFATPTVGATALRMAFLRGYEEPQIFMKAPNARRIGGGEEPFSFEQDEISYKVRHITGQARLDPALTIASNGSGA